MKSVRYALAFTAVFLATPAAAEVMSIADFFPNCASPSDASGRTLTVDAKNSRSGSYSNIAAALQVAKPGDTIALMTGDYGLLNLNGMNQNGFITIAAANGQSPKFTDIFIGGYKPASHWRLTGLTISGFVHRADNRAQGTLVMIGNSNNIIIDNNDLYSQDGMIDWQAQVPAASSPDTVPNGISARQSNCISIVNNRLRNIFNGVDFGGDQIGDHGKYFLVSGNSIDNFAGDGIDHYGSHVRIDKNQITNGHDICNNTCVHNDGIQGWNYNHLPVSNSDVTIEDNVIIAQTMPNLVLPVDTLQGITIFDGKWDNVKIINNLVIANAWHGISIYGVHNAEIINNTVAPTNPARATWIGISRAKGDPPDAVYEAVVRNNVFPGTSKKLPRGNGIVTDHNQGFPNAEEYAEGFVKFDPDHFIFDMHPTKGSPVIGEGSQDGAPTTDIEGTLRQSSIDIGAYAYKRK